MDNCPKCNGELKKGQLTKEKDGTEYFELTCTKCGERFADIKIPYDALWKIRQPSNADFAA